MIKIRELLVCGATVALLMGTQQIGSAAAEGGERERGSAGAAIAGGGAGPRTGGGQRPAVSQRQQPQVVQRRQPQVIQRQQDNRRTYSGNNRAYRGTRYAWGDGYVFYFYDGYYHGDCAWLRRKATETGSSYWLRRYRQCRADD